MLVGFTTYAGTVTAASDWGAPAERKRVRPALAESYEALFHDAGIPRLPALPARAPAAAAARCASRAWSARSASSTGPQTERQSHWFAASAARQFDALVHLDVTRAVEPLERTQRWELGEPPETYPSAL